MKPDIVYEDQYLIACIKPYGVPSQSDKTYDADMITLVKEFIYDRDGLSEEPYLAIINRLDRPVSGIILFAKDEDTAAKLSDMIQDREISKFYQVVVKGFFDEPEGELSDYLLHDKKTNMTKVVSKGTKGAKKAELFYEVLDELDTDEGPVSYLLVELLTGRHHQIRCQMAAHGHPVWGDTKYAAGSEAKGAGIKGTGKKGSGKKGSGRNEKDKYEIGLYSTRLEFVHPVTGEEILLHREPEGSAFEIADQMDW